jgi:hypothetical protein
VNLDSEQTIKQRLAKKNTSISIRPKTGVPSSRPVREHASMQRRTRRPVLQTEGEEIVDIKSKGKSSKNFLGTTFDSCPEPRTVRDKPSTHRKGWMSVPMADLASTQDTKKIVSVTDACQKEN